MFYIFVKTNLIGTTTKPNRQIPGLIERTYKQMQLKMKVKIQKDHEHAIFLSYCSNFSSDLLFCSADAKLSKDTLWLSLNQLVELFGRDKSVISRHLKKIFSENELEENPVVAKYAEKLSFRKCDPKGWRFLQHPLIYYCL